ncbi:hypothetical protein [Tessaracoccus sp. ZS01]|uniref:hypothetical protein n=1 Tax=Tessaracoccus sp. ZS01 TaxID=1906324 RepID=UPI00117F18F3|nr:hypothetical protein [Tessaracoccus sp. ZS01]
MGLIVADLAILSKVWWMTGRGLDLTDEGMYLNWMTSPWDWPWASTQFAFFFHPLWILAGQDLVLVRRYTVLLLLLVGVVFFAAVLRRSFALPRGRSLAWGALLTPTVLLGVGSQSVFFTPSYNLLGLIGLLVSGAALVGILLPAPAATRRPKLGLWPWVVLGVGGVICFASRPTAGALLLVLVLIALVVAGRWSWRGLGVAAGVALTAFLIMALLIDGGPVRFLERVLEGLELYSIQTQRGALDAVINTFTYDQRWERSDILWGVFIGVALAAAVFLRRAGRGAPHGLATLAALSGIAAALVTAVGFNPLHGRVGRSVTVAFFLWVGPALALLTGRSRLGRGSRAVIGALWLLPFVYAFGTHYSTVALAGSAAFCWLGASVAALGSARNGRAALPVVGGLWLLVTALCLNAAAGAPPRQEPLEAQDRALDLAGHGQIYLSPDMSRYLEAVAVGVAAEGFVPGTPVLDLTGESPGLIYHLQATATADSWVIGRYPGSRDRLALELNLHTECSVIGDSWLLVSPGGVRRIDPEVLGEVGLMFPDDYRLVVGETSPERSGGYAVEVWAPRSGAGLTDRCLAQR